MDDKNKPHYKTKIIVDALIANDEFELAFEETKKFLRNVAHIDENLILSSHEWVYKTQIELLDELVSENSRIASKQNLYDKLFVLALKRNDKSSAIKWRAEKAKFEYQCANRSISYQRAGQSDETWLNYYLAAQETYKACYENFRMNSDKTILEALYEMLYEQYSNTDENDDDEAIAVCIKMIEIGALIKAPNLSCVVDELGHALENDLKFHAAKKIYGSFIQFAQQSHPEYIFKARLYEARCHAGDLDHPTAIEKLNSLLSDSDAGKFDQYSYAMRLLAISYQEQGKFHKAISCWEEVKFLSMGDLEKRWDFAIGCYGKIKAIRDFLKTADVEALNLKRYLYHEVLFFLENITPREKDSCSGCDINDVIIEVLTELSDFQWPHNSQLNEKDMLEKAAFIIDNFENEISTETKNKIRNRLQTF
jgi:hypothetical protein